MSIPLESRPQKTQAQARPAPQSFTAEGILTRVFVAAVGLVIIVALAMRVQTLQLMPIDWDENYYLNIGSNFIERGGLTPYMWRLDPDTNIIAGSGTGYGIYALVIWLKYAGLTFESGRWFMFIVSMLNVVAMYGLATAWWGRHEAGLVAAAFAAALSTSFASAYVRMDAPGVLSYTLVLWVYIAAVRRDVWWLHVAAGVAAIAAAEVHILATLYIAAISLVYAAETAGKLWEERYWRALFPAAWFGVGALVAGLLYIAVHILPDPQAYFIIPNDCPNCEPASIAKEVSRYTKYWQAFPVEAVVGIIVVRFALARFRPADRRYIMLVIGFVLALAVVSPPDQPRYILHGWALIALGAGGMLSLPDGSMSAARRWLLREAALIGLVALLLFQWTEFDSYRNPRFQLTLGEQRRAAVQMDFPTDTVIMGYAPYFADFLDYPLFLSYATDGGENYGIELRGETYTDFQQREQPEVIIAHIEGNPVMMDYIRDVGFVRIMDHFWVHPALCGQGYCN